MVDLVRMRTFNSAWCTKKAMKAQIADARLMTIETTDKIGQATCADHAALFAACEPGVGLCTIVAIEGSFSRRLGAQLAVQRSGDIVGSLSDGCLERQLAADLQNASGPIVQRYGYGSGKIDFRLPCGGGLDILLDPAPDQERCRRAALTLSRRETANLVLPVNSHLRSRVYIPALAIRVFGEGPEMDALEAIARSAGISVEGYRKSNLVLGRLPDLPPADKWTATVLLFHDHEWEVPLLTHALMGKGFLIGAQGGQTAQFARMTELLRAGIAVDELARVRGPIGTIPRCRTPSVLALSILSEIVGEYESLHPHH